MRNEALQGAWAVMAAVMNRHTDKLARYYMWNDPQTALIAKADREGGVRQSDSDILVEVEMSVERGRGLGTSEPIEDCDRIKIVQA
jgi:hypothetical protein